MIIIFIEKGLVSRSMIVFSPYLLYVVGFLGCRARELNQRGVKYNLKKKKGISRFGSLEVQAKGIK